MIHKSHSKKELCDIIKTFEIDIDKPETMKTQLVSKLTTELQNMDTIKPELIDMYSITLSI